MPATRLLIACLAAVMLPPSAWAQTTTQFPIQFDFLNPGARSLALGSAFIGLADDASAGFTNPAGLQHLVVPEVSVEGRFRQVDTRFLERGRISGSVLNIGEDTVAGPVYGEDRDRHFGLSFLSFSYPTRRWAVAVYRHELSRVSNDFLYRGVFERATFVGVTDDRNRDLPLSGTRRIDIDNYGVSGAVRLNDRVAIGAGLSVYRFALDASFMRLGLDGLFGAPTATGSGSTAVQTARDYGTGFSVGIQAQVLPSVRIGGVVRKAPDFEFTQVDTIPFRDDLVRTGTFQVPDTYGLGAAWRVNDAVTLAADYVWVQHAALKEDFIEFQAISTGRPEQLDIDSVQELHVGVEWVLTALRMTPALRGGFWFDPDHSVRYVSDGSNDQIDVRFRYILPGSEDLWHYTLGVGIPVSRRLELNAASDFTKRSAYASASLVVRF